MKPEKCIFILGMHRSGTSALTGVFTILGADVGRNLMRAADDNVTGFFENDSVYRFNEDLLHFLESSWDSVFPLPERWWTEDRLKPYRERLKRIVGDEYSGPLMAVKDPRLCRLLPLWKDALAELGIECRIVIPVRNPLEVAGSINRRNGFSFGKAVMLWTGHTFEAELYSRDLPRVFLTFDELLADVRGAIDEIGKTLRLTWPVPFAERRDEVAKYLKPDLKHFSVDRRDGEDAVWRVVSDWHECLRRLAKNRDATDADTREIDALRNQFRRMYDFFYFDEIRSLARQADVNSRKLAEQENMLKTGELRQRVQENLLKIKNEELSKREKRISDLEEMIAVSNAVLEKRTGEIHDLLHSTSWRVTAPARAFSRLIASGSLKAAAFKAARWLARGVYRRLPLSSAMKHEMKYRVASAFRIFLKGTSLHRFYLAEREWRTTGMASFPAAKFCSHPGVIRRNLKKGAVRFAPAGHPKVSVIIPVFNQAVHTYNCLKSISDQPAAAECEVIVIDDCSTDQTADMLSRISGLRMTRNGANVGFIRSCNRAAGLARGEYLVFLNNDTMVTPGWLDWLLRTFSFVPDAGLVGAKLLLPDGRLQEAGGVIRRNGSAYHYGRGDDPRLAPYNYLREVDFSSGACLMIPRRLFLDLGSFDEHYVPAYYEDVDLAFRVRAAGKKVLYQPHAGVVHFEGTTSGTDTAAGVKRYQVVNQAKFYERWREELALCESEVKGVDCSHERRVIKRILVIDVCVCMPDQDAGSLRMYHLLRILQDLEYKVCFFPDNHFYPQSYVRELQARGIEILTGNSAGWMETYLKETGRLFDIVLLSRVDVAEKYIGPVREYCPEALVLFDTVDLHFLREKREAEVKNDPLLRQAALETKSRELAIADKSDITIVVSHEEKKQLALEDPGLTVEVIPTIHPVYGSKTPFALRRGALFIGGFRFSPNVDAVLFFVNEVLPLIRARLPDFTIHLIGSEPPPAVTGLASRAVVVTGHVPDIEPYFNRCRISVAPLRWGAGVKGKINTSMAYGVPVIATPTAVDGMFLRHETDVLVAAGPKEFADAVVRLSGDETLWNRLSANGVENVKRHFSFAAAETAVRSILEDAGTRRASRERSS